MVSAAPTSRRLKRFRHCRIRARPPRTRHAQFPNINARGLPALRAECSLNNDILAAPAWTTASFGDSADTSPMELSALGEHLHLCKGSRGRLFALHCVAETMHGFVAARLITTVVAVALLIGIVLLVW